MKCEKCETDMIAVESKKSVSGIGIFGALLFVIGAATMFGNPIFGFIIIIIGIVISMSGNKKQITMTCPKCGHKGATITP